MSNPDHLRYTESHEWLRIEADGTVTVGITDFAQQALGDLVFVELPQPGRTLKQAEACCVVESVKAASDVYAPLAGDVVAANDEVKAAPEKINENAFDAWLFRIRPSAGVPTQGLLSAAEYESMTSKG